MTAGKAPWSRATFEPLGNRRGAVLALIAIGLVGMLLVSGLALDLGRGYVLRAQLSRAVDAAALAAARSLRAGTDVAEQRARAVAAADELRRRERQERNRRLDAKQAETERTLIPAAELNANIELLTHATLLAVGFYLHRRIEWRRQQAEI